MAMLSREMLGKEKAMSPCLNCTYRIVKRVYPQTREEPEEVDDYCSQDMNSFYDDEGCYKYSECCGEGWNE